MRIEIQVDTDEQKDLIREELMFIPEVCSAMDCAPSITGIWVPSNFDETVNMLQGTDNFVSERGQKVIAKNVIQELGTALVFSPYLYTDFFDRQMRLQTYLHEFWHAVNKDLFPGAPDRPRSRKLYFENIYILYDEYSANRKSFELTEKLVDEISDKYTYHIRSATTGFLKDMIAEEHYRHISKEISAYRQHRDVNLFLQNTRDVADLIMKALVYFFSYVHHYPRYERFVRFLNRSTFINKDALLLADYFKLKYEQGNTDLADGLTYMINFMKRFGVLFEDVPSGLYCHVINIERYLGN